MCVCVCRYASGRAIILEIEKGCLAEKVYIHTIPVPSYMLDTMQLLTIY